MEKYTKYSNIFNSYDKGNFENKKYMLEMNITRSFFSTIYNLEEKTTEKFLHEIFKKEEFKEIRSQIKGKPEIILERSLKIEDLKKDKLLILITGYGHDEYNKENREKNKDIRVDGLLNFTNLSIIFEAKLLSLPADDQINAYKKKYEIECFNIIYWEYILDSCNEILNNNQNVLNDKDKFLLKQLSDFLSNEGFGKLLLDKFEKNQTTNDISDKDILYFKSQLNKLLKKFNNDNKFMQSFNVHNKWTKRNDNKEQEFDIILKNEIYEISYNLFTFKGIFSISLFGYTNNGYDFLLKKTNKKNIPNDYIINYHIKHNEGKPINYNYKLEDYDDYYKMNACYNELRKKIKKNIGLCISVYKSFDLSNEIWEKDYESQINIIKDTLMELVEYIKD
ncbi:MAG: hypothetical protein JXB50_16425 [Spirochaetes bacterium]|nr:hypothetical protein [Spirochaetota bacterium]